MFFTTKAKCFLQQKPSLKSDSITASAAAGVYVYSAVPPQSGKTFKGIIKNKNKNRRTLIISVYLNRTVRLFRRFVDIQIDL